MPHPQTPAPYPCQALDTKCSRSGQGSASVWFLFLFSALLVCAADWLSKGYARQNLYFIENPSSRPWIIIPLVVFLCAAVVYLTGSKIAAVGCGIALGGMTGNLAELFYYGAVTDWVPMPGSAYANIADFAVCIVPAITLAIFVGLYARQMSRPALVGGLLMVAGLAMIGTLRLTLIVDRVGQPLF